jgi:hypothetical protein
MESKDVAGKPVSPDGEVESTTNVTPEPPAAAGAPEKLNAKRGPPQKDTAVSATTVSTTVSGNTPSPTPTAVANAMANEGLLHQGITPNASP